MATENAGKLAELQAIFAGSPLELQIYPQYAAPVEGATSYMDNALLKAQTLRERLIEDRVKSAVLADDSGLEVAALDGRPGVLTSRYGGADLDWPARRAFLLAELKAVPAPARGARFVCALALVCPDGFEALGYGEAAGTIAAEERGHAGFGYDPLFVDNESGRTYAEMSSAEKQRVSHRARAAKELLERLALRG